MGGFSAGPEGGSGAPPMIMMLSVTSSLLSTSLSLKASPIVFLVLGMGFLLRRILILSVDCRTVGPPRCDWMLSFIVETGVL